MKSRSSLRATAHHGGVSDRARAERGRWFLANVYPDRSSGVYAVRRVEGAVRMPSYEPAGSFQAYAAPHDEGTALWVRHVAGDEPLPALPDRMSVRLRGDNERTGYEGAGVITVTVSTLCPRCGGPRGASAGHRFHADGDWYVVDRWSNSCGHIDIYAAVLRESREVILPLPADDLAPRVETDSLAPSRKDSL